MDTFGGHFSVYYSKGDTEKVGEGANLRENRPKACTQLFPPSFQLKTISSSFSPSAQSVSELLS